MLNQTWINRWKAAAQALAGQEHPGQNSPALQPASSPRTPAPAKLFETVGYEFMRSIRHMVVHLVKDPEKRRAFTPTEIICHDMGLTDEIFVVLVQDGLCMPLITDRATRFPPSLYKVTDNAVYFLPSKKAVVTKTASPP